LPLELFRKDYTNACDSALSLTGRYVLVTRESSTHGDNSLARVHAYVVHQHALRENGGIGRVARQNTADSEIQQNKKRMIVHPTFPRWEIRWRPGCIKLVVDKEAHDSRFPFNRKNMKPIAESTSG